jgi:hypothetical protein
MLDCDLTPGWTRCLWEPLATFPSLYTREVNCCTTSQSSLVAILLHRHRIACRATIKDRISTTQSLHRSTPTAAATPPQQPPQTYSCLYARVKCSSTCLPANHRRDGAGAHRSLSTSAKCANSKATSATHYGSAAASQNISTDKVLRAAVTGTA